MATTVPIKIGPNRTRAELREHLKACLRRPDGVVAIGFTDGTMYVKSPADNFRGIVPESFIPAPKEDGWVYVSGVTINLMMDPESWFCRANSHPGLTSFFNKYTWTAERGFVADRSLYEDVELVKGGAQFV